MQLSITTANAFAPSDRKRLAVGCVALLIMLTYGYFLIRDVRDMLRFLPIRSLWPKEQIERDIDVLEACTYDETHTNHGRRLFLKSLENDQARHSSQDGR
jgi:hypothetical protein